MSFYFALILRIARDEVVLFAAAVLLGAAWAFVIAHLVLPERPRVALRDSLTAFGDRLVTAMDALVDAVSWARWDKDVRRHAAADEHQVHSGAAYLAGLLTGPAEETGVSAGSAAVLRLRVFDTELAVVSLVAAARDLTGAGIPLEQRARLAGRLELLQAHLAALEYREPASTAPPSGALPTWTAYRPPSGWVQEARALHRAMNELYRAAAALRTAADRALDPSAPAAPALGTHDPTADVLLAELQDGRAVTDAGGPRHDTNLRRAVQAAVTTGGSLAAGALVSSAHQYWATLAAYQVLGGTDGETVVKVAQRILGTLGGTAVGFAVAVWTGSEPAVVLPLLAVAVFASTYYRPVSPAVSVFWTTMIFALMYEFLGRLTTQAVEIRIAETVVGAGVALVVAWLVLPTRTRTSLNRDLGALVTTLRIVAAMSLGRLGGDPRITSSAVTRQLLTGDRELRQVRSTAAPLRRSAGAFEAGGIEAQLTAVWSLVHDARRLADAAARAAEAEGDAEHTEDWVGLQHVTDDNLAALGVALSGGLPNVVHDDLDVVDDHDPTSAGHRPEEAVLHHTDRINQTALLLIDIVSPGALEASASRVEGRAG